jgi:hypothetical protein
MSLQLSRPCSVAFIVVLCLLITGCGSKVNQANYDKIKNGMTEKEVEDILGKGEEQASAGGNALGMSMSGKAKAWKDGTKLITVSFIDGKVTAKAQNGL